MMALHSWLVELSYSYCRTVELSLPSLNRSRNSSSLEQKLLGSDPGMLNHKISKLNHLAELGLVRAALSLQASIRFLFLLAGGYDGRGQLKNLFDPRAFTTSEVSAGEFELVSFLLIAHCQVDGPNIFWEKSRLEEFLLLEFEVNT